MASLVMSVSAPPAPRSPNVENLQVSTSRSEISEGLPVPGTISLPLSMAGAGRPSQDSLSTSPALHKAFSDWPASLEGFQSHNLPPSSLLSHGFHPTKTDLAMHLVGARIPDQPIRPMSLHLPPHTASSPASRDLILQKSVLDFNEGQPNSLNPWPYPLYYPYDGLPPYPIPPGYGLSFDTTPRKNATRESTATLKAWLNEHKKNPYPTKGEKIMLAIITKMTLTQVSTWFANARRRIKKEKKISWDTKSNADEDDDDEEEHGKDDDRDASKKDYEDNRLSMDEDREEADPRRSSQSPSSTTDDAGSSHSSLIKPRIWSLADLAVSPASTQESNSSLGGKIAFHRSLHAESSPYGRPFGTQRIVSPHEAFLQVYAKSFGLPFPYHQALQSLPNALQSHPVALPPLGLGVFPTPMPHVSPTPSSSSSTVTRPLPTRIFVPSSVHARDEHNLFTGGSRETATSSTSSASPTSWAK